jgi:hypothetical protein
VRPVEQLWQAARPALLAEDAAPETVLEVRRVFFVGASCMWTVQQHLAGLDQDALRSFCADVSTELATFRATIESVLEAKV